MEAILVYDEAYCLLEDKKYKLQSQVEKREHIQKNHRSAVIVSPATSAPICIITIDAQTYRMPKATLGLLMMQLQRPDAFKGMSVEHKIMLFNYIQQSIQTEHNAPISPTECGRVITALFQFGRKLQAENAGQAIARLLT